ncbi:Ig-like domain-containing protein [Paenibacillus sp. 1P07SE]|uniref:Ig-like domain-containing protein n=1 Tax=Paenibacillus sp. 1P07SE TaxID=3132209 RepID=UPI0039A6DD41
MLGSARRISAILVLTLALFAFPPGWSAQLLPSPPLQAAEASATAEGQWLDRFSFEPATITSPSDLADFSGMHPRLFITPDGLSELKAKIHQPQYHPQYQVIMSQTSSPLALAFRYLITEDPELGDQAISAMLDVYRGFTDADVEDRGRSYMTAYTYGPMVYDWCYDRLTTAQKDEFISHFVRAATFPDKPPGFPINQNANTLTGHHSAGWFYNQLWMGLAIYDEDPAMWNGALDFFLKEHQHVLNFTFPSGISEQGWYISRYAYPTHFILMMHQLTGGERIVDSSHEVALDQLLYYLRPDGQQIRTGSVAADTSGSEEYKYTMLDILGNMYENGVYKNLKSYFAPRDQVMEAALDIIVRPATLEALSFEGVPLVRFFPEPIGSEMIARSGWDTSGQESDDYVVQMRGGHAVIGGHQHMDFGTFQLYYKGNLTGPSGAYRGSQTDFNQPHWRHYYRSTIANNGLIIYNPDQVDGNAWQDPQNDGGAHFPRTSGSWEPNKLQDFADPSNEYNGGDLIARGTDEQNGTYNYAYLSADLTKGYQHSSDPANPDRANLVTRSMVTMPTEEADHPLAFFVFDRVLATDESYLKKFILHTATNPVISGNKMVSSAARAADGYKGQLASWTLLPEQPTFDVVEGYKVGYGAHEKDYPIGTPVGSFYEEMGYRLEVSQAAAGAETRFLHALTVSEEGIPVTAEAELIEAGAATGAKLFNKNVIFSDDGAPMASASFTITGDGQQSILVTDLVPGAYFIDRTDRPAGDYLQYGEVDEVCKCLYIEGNSGTYSVTRTSATAESAAALVQRLGGNLLAPEVSVSAPGPDAIVSGPVTLTAAAVDATGIAGVQFMLNGRKLGPEQTTEPYSYTWDTTAASDGHYSLTALARDEGGLVRLSEPIHLTVHNEAGFLPWYASFDSGADLAFTGAGDWAEANGKLVLEHAGTAPSIARSSRVFTGDLKASVDAQLWTGPGSSGHVRLVFDYMDEDNYRYLELHETASESGLYQYAGGTLSKLTGVERSLIPGATNRLEVRRNGQFADLYINGVFVAQAQLGSVADGSIGVSASNDARFGNLAVRPIMDGQEVDVQPPQVTILSPAASTTLSGQLEVTAEAIDNDEVANVQFLLNGLYLGDAKTSETDTYAVDWDTTIYPNGTYNLSAVATDQAGNRKHASVVSVTVDNPDAQTVIEERFNTDEGGFSVVSGGTWAVTEGRYQLSGAVNLTPLGNLAIHDTPVSGAYMVTVDAGNTGSWNGFRDFAVIFDYQDAGNYYYASFGQTSDANAGGFFKVSGGTRTKLTSFTGRVDPPTMYTVNVIRDGSQMRAYVSGELVGSATDGTVILDGKTGIGSVNDATLFDNFIVTELES